MDVFFKFWEIYNTIQYSVLVAALYTLSRFYGVDKSLL